MSVASELGSRGMLLLGRAALDSLLADKATYFIYYSILQAYGMINCTLFLDPNTSESLSCRILASFVVTILRPWPTHSPCHASIPFYAAATHAPDDHINCCFYTINEHPTPLQSLPRPSPPGVVENSVPPGVVL